MALFEWDPHRCEQNPRASSFFSFRHFLSRMHSDALGIRELALHNILLSGCIYFPTTAYFLWINGCHALHSPGVEIGGFWLAGSRLGFFFSLPLGYVTLCMALWTSLAGSTRELSVEEKTGWGWEAWDGMGWINAGMCQGGFFWRDRQPRRIPQQRKTTAETSALFRACIGGKAFPPGTD